MNNLINKVVQWHRDRNLIDGANDKDQLAKLVEEMGELSSSICKGKSVKDDIGDMMVVLINIAERNHTNLEECLEVAYNDIKDRKGRMVDGIFIKEADDAGIVSASWEFRHHESSVATFREAEIYNAANYLWDDTMIYSPSYPSDGISSASCEQTMDFNAGGADCIMSETMSDPISSTVNITSAGLDWGTTSVVDYNDSINVSYTVEDYPSSKSND